MRIIKKTHIYLVLTFMFIFNGCAFLGIDFTETRTIAIQKSPYVVIMDGDIEQKDIKHVEKMIQMLSTQPYIKHDNANFQVHVTDQTTITKGTTMSESSSVGETVTDATTKTIIVDPQKVKVEQQNNINPSKWEGDDYNVWYQILY